MNEVSFVAGEADAGLRDRLEDGSLVGFAPWLETGGVFELEDLFVDPGWRRRGIAAALVDGIAQILRARGVQRLEVTANPHALGFYRAAGSAPGLGRACDVRCGEGPGVCRSGGRGGSAASALSLSGKATCKTSGEPLLMAWGLRVDHVGGLPKRPGYPLPCP
jgi:GNAT superfamily N-acetyltransferase